MRLFAEAHPRLRERLLDKIANGCVDRNAPGLRQVPMCSILNQFVRCWLPPHFWKSPALPPGVELWIFLPIGAECPEATVDGRRSHLGGNGCRDVLPARR